MFCLSPTQIKLESGLVKYFPCGKCIPCRINRTQMWTIRLAHEAQTWEHSAFVTLTYDNDHLPADKGLCKEDLQKFFKRLRSRLFENERQYLSESIKDFACYSQTVQNEVIKHSNHLRRIKYYACGEYGEHPIESSDPYRPHYHAIVFGIDPYSTTDLQLIADCWQNCPSWKFTDKRQNCVGYVSFDSINYVTSYCQKKLFGDKAVETYGNRIAPFSLSSQGLGLKYFIEEESRAVENGYIDWKGSKVAIPSYYKKKLDLHYFNSESKQGLYLMDFLKKSGFDDDDIKNLYRNHFADSEMYESVRFNEAMEQYRKNAVARNNLCTKKTF